MTAARTVVFTVELEVTISDAATIGQMFDSVESACADVSPQLSSLRAGSKVRVIRTTAAQVGEGGSL